MGLAGGGRAGIGEAAEKKEERVASALAPYLPLRPPPASRRTCLPLLICVPNGLPGFAGAAASAGVSRGLLGPLQQPPVGPRGAPCLGAVSRHGCASTLDVPACAGGERGPSCGVPGGGGGGSAVSPGSASAKRRWKEASPLLRPLAFNPCGDHQLWLFCMVSTVLRAAPHAD